MPNAAESDTPFGLLVGPRKALKDMAGGWGVLVWAATAALAALMVLTVVARPIALLEQDLTKRAAALRKNAAASDSGPGQQDEAV